MESGWRNAPKIELHLHLEGAAPPDLTRRIAAEQRTPTDGLFDADGGYAWGDFTEFLKVYDVVAAFYKAPEASARLAEAVLTRAAENGVIYMEIFLSPDHVSPKGGADPIAWAEHLAAVTEGAERAEAASGVVARFIPLCVRGLGVVGWGMAGDERMFRPADFAPAFRLAAEAGLRLTAHAGEFGGPESVRGALEDLKVERVGHGVRAIEDPALVARLAEEGITLEVCPGSNIALGVYPNWPSHPLKRLRDVGVPVTVSTDDPPFFHTTMTREWNMAAKAFGLDSSDFEEISLAALDAAFCDRATKENLRARLASGRLDRAG